MDLETSQDSTESEEDDQEETMLRAQLLLSMAKKQEKRIKDIEVSTLIYFSLSRQPPLPPPFTLSPPSSL